MRFAASLMGPDAAEDVVSEVVVATLRRGRLSDLDHPEAYLMKAVLNAASIPRKTTGSGDPSDHEGGVDEGGG